MSQLETFLSRESAALKKEWPGERYISIDNKKRREWRARKTHRQRFREEETVLWVVVNCGDCYQLTHMATFTRVARGGGTDTQGVLILMIFASVQSVASRSSLSRTNTGCWSAPPGPGVRYK